MNTDNKYLELLTEHFHTSKTTPIQIEIELDDVILARFSAN